ncbi:phosphatase PAP2 family protein [Natrinema pallidum]|uniref:Phosphoesterase PA-phosphatase-related protein n=1 Tax=Natrinema pallidum DSM 3751 TaxID=1227495 RepID=L9YET1_9EURY|nr:phosphatase PAP2 family protein [Natrinema pallidum]ELY72629.1 phosphoesterase PA-phosphatase-related protein [Natrinema pallidum DSM 3751]
MNRGAALLESIRDFVPQWGVAVAAAVTRLGDGLLLLALGIGASWAIAWRRTGQRGRQFGTGRPSRRPDGPWFLAVIVGGLATMTALKHLFSLPRPELATVESTVFPSPIRSVSRSSASAGGYGFPSGHAVGATVTYGLFAMVFETGTRRLRLAGAGVIVTAVCLTRLVLGVHYPLDVVAGVVVGWCYLAGVRWLLERSPFDRTATAFALALGLAGAAMVASGRADSAVAYAALAAGALAGWTLEQSTPPLGSTAVDRRRLKPVALLVAVVSIAAVVGIGVSSGPSKLLVSAALLGFLSTLPALALSRVRMVVQRRLQRCHGERRPNPFASPTPSRTYVRR